MAIYSNDFRARRRRLDLSQVDLAAQLGCSGTAISLVERSAPNQRRALAARLDALLTQLERASERRERKPSQQPPPSAP